MRSVGPCAARSAGREADMDAGPAVAIAFGIGLIWAMMIAVIVAALRELSKGGGH